MTRILRAMTMIASAATLTILLVMSARTTASAQAQPGALPGQAELRLNELMSSNNTTLVDPQEPDETPDWIEIYNPTAAEVSLVGMALTDDPSEPDKHVITQSLTISANGYLILYADNDPEQGAAHLNFGLSAAGEYLGLYLTNPAGAPTLLDEISFPAVPTDASYARSGNGAGDWSIGRPTPGKSNNTNPPWVSAVTTPTVNADTPAPLGPVTISAIITDDVGVTTVALVYMTMTAPYSPALSVWVSTPMTIAGGDQYQAQIPAMAPATLVKYYVEASDILGDSTRFPLPGREYGYLAGYTPPRLLINKVVSSNAFIPDPDEPGETPDWIELYNPGGVAVSLDGLAITNDRTEPLKFRVPDGVTIPAGGLLTFLADDDIGQNSLPAHKVWHMNFTLTNADDYIGVYGGEGTAVVDAFDWDNPPRWGAFGRVPTGAAWNEKSIYVCVLQMSAANVLCDKEIFMPNVRK
ncbi:lamin tail domain-containing protein [Caldilinea sp.]|uniref:lamin tail domain-containing protein n=1 Tax=Caldilinea sp. TaxID=2293560 RepID=UPI002C322D59|nr:lamin tail domain-containing protein [Anaerolineales bacterium]HQY93688.1 lamin tail domain-containing protein [Caldilinea sp.]HRA67573.1 lamin tail domain-containing protein [Caldilinea sp.]